MATFKYKTGLTSLLLLLFLAGCNSSSPPAAAKLQPVTLCQGGILATLPIIAREKGFFKDEGLSVDISLLGDGKAAMSGFLEGKCDVSLTGEFPFVRQSFEQNDLVIIATLVSSDNAVKVLARRDRGINSVEELKGKRIGVSRGTISNFFLDQFLKKNKIPAAGLTIRDLSHIDLPDALRRGDIDAFAGTDFAYLKARQIIGEQGITFAEPGLTNHMACITVKKGWLATNEVIAQKLLKALIKAEKELAIHPDDFMELLAKQLNIPLDQIKIILSEQNNSVTIDQVLLLSLEDEARWMQQTGMVKKGAVPNYLHLLDTSVLNGINPSAVRLK